jgi:hypothetical protein
MGIGYSRDDLNRIAQGGLEVLRSIRGSRRGGVPPSPGFPSYSPGGYGRGSGKYMGFDTLGQLQDYYAGRGAILDEWADEAGQALLEEVKLGYDRVAEKDARARAEAYERLSSVMPTWGEVPELSAQIDKSVQDPFFQNLGISADALKSRRVSKDVVVTTPARSWSRPPGSSGLDVLFGDASWQPHEVETYPRKGGPVQRSVMWAPDEGYVEPYVVGTKPGTVDYIGKRLWSQNVTPEMQAAYDEYIAGLDEFTKREADRLAEGAARAGEFMNPTRTQWAREAAIAGGLDPALAYEWYGDERELADKRRQLDLARIPLEEFDLQRDLQALDLEYGSWSEYQQALDDAYAQDAAVSKAGAEAEAEAQKRLRDRVTFELTDMGEDDLAQAADVPVELLPEVLDSDLYSWGVEQIRNLFTDEGVDPFELNAVLYDVTRFGSPAIARVLAAQFGLPSLRYDFNDFGG